MPAFGYVVDEGWIHVFVIARGGLDARRVRRAFHARADSVRDSLCRAAGTRQPLATLLVGDINGIVIDGSGLDDWRSGKVDFVAGECRRCGAVSFAVCLHTWNDWLRFEELRSEDVLFKALFDGVISERGSGDWHVSCIGCRLGGDGGRRAA